MNKIILILIILTSNLAFSQSKKKEVNFKFRQLTGNLTDHSGQPFPGQTVMIKGMDIGTQTDFDGNFCLIVPTDIVVFIELSFCFEQIFRKIEPVDKTIELRIGKGKQKTKKAWRDYNKVHINLNPELNKIYNSEEYKNMENICD